MSISFSQKYLRSGQNPPNQPQANKRTETTLSLLGKNRLHNIRASGVSPVRMLILQQ